MSVARTKKRPTSMPLTHHTAWLLGLYVAEGYSFKKDVSFCLGKHESTLAEELSKRIVKLGYRPFVRQTRTAKEVHLQSRILARAFPAWCGKGARLKHVPPFIISNSKDNLVQALRSITPGPLRQGQRTLPEDRAKPALADQNTCEGARYGRKCRERSLEDS